jgi:hypothetical protein
MPGKRTLDAMNEIEAPSLEVIDARLARIEAMLAALMRFEPLLVEAAKRMEGPMRWRRPSG